MQRTISNEHCDERAAIVAMPADLASRVDIRVRKVARVLSYALLMAGVALAGRIAGAEPLSSALSDGTEQVDTLPPDLAVPDELPSPKGGTGDGDKILSDMDWLEDRDTSDEYSYFDDGAPIISSGTWFRRGYWYVQEDVVIFALDLDKDLALASESLNGFTIDQVFVVKGSSPGIGANARLTLGRFLYRDAKNRDHTAEFTFTGLGKWEADGRIRSLVDADSISTILSPAAIGFINNVEQTFHYTSRMNNYEWNYRIRRRLRPDWLELDPCGEWTRQMDPGLLYGFLFGVRWFEMPERFAYHGEGVDPNETRGDLLTQTRNNLIGFQFGGDAIYQHKRWSVSLFGKVGPSVNFSHRSIEYEGIGVDGNGAPISDEVHAQNSLDTIAFIGEAGCHATYYAQPNLAFRVGWDAFWVNNLALATRQIQILEGSNAVRNVNTTSGVQYMGFSLGMDYHW